MKLNTLKPSKGSKHVARRVGRGIGSGLGKTCGRGHKGQHARSGGYHKVGFEGGQMPLARRLPKFGFSSRVGRVTAEVRLHELNLLDVEDINLDTLKAAGIIRHDMLHAKIMLSGEIKKAVKVASDVRVTKGAKAAIEKAGGSVEDHG